VGSLHYLKIFNGHKPSVIVAAFTLIDVELMPRHKHDVIDTDTSL
jgi:hypothetical protein